MTSLVRRMVRDGWDVHVITARRAAEQTADADSAGYIPPEVSVERTGSLELYRRINAGLSGGKGPAIVRWLRRIAVVPFLPLYPLSRFPDKQVGWTWHLFFALRRALSKRPGAVVLSSSPPHSCHMPIAFLHRLRRFRWVVDFRDPWTAPVRQPRGATSRRLQRLLERDTLRCADSIIVNTPGNRVSLLDAFPFAGATGVHVVTNGYDPGLAPAGDAEEPVSASADIVYVGEVYPGMLDLYLAAAGIIRPGGGRVPELHVYGIFDEREKAAVRSAGLEDAVVSMGVVSWQRSLEIMSDAPSLLLLLQHHERWRSCVPSKLYPYLYSGTPVVAVTSDDAAEVAGRMQAFFAPGTATVHERRPEAIDLYDMNHLSAKIQRILEGKEEARVG
jgi:glycosyltransferase involved in cell wall biosynthesis